jgi:CheY-like chemotaxis protein
MGNQMQNRPVVLVVEDEPLALMDAVELVSGAGFEALSARNADDAIVILESRDDIRVIFTDVNMPGSMDGLKLACVARNRWPPIEIIVTSGLDFKAAPRLPERGVFLSKPYTPAQITGALLRLAA